MHVHTTYVRMHTHKRRDINTCAHVCTHKPVIPQEYNQTGCMAGMVIGYIKAFMSSLAHIIFLKQTEWAMATLQNRGWGNTTNTETHIHTQSCSCACSCHLKLPIFIPQALYCAYVLPPYYLNIIDRSGIVHQKNYISTTMKPFFAPE